MGMRSLGPWKHSSLPFEGCQVEILEGMDDRPGWLTSRRGKSFAFDTAAQKIKDREVDIRDRKTKAQLQDVDIEKLANVNEGPRRPCLGLRPGATGVRCGPAIFDRKGDGVVSSNQVDEFDEFPRSKEVPMPGPLYFLPLL